jgi:hypothetical protein
VAQDFAQALQRAKGHAAKAELAAVYNTFDALKDRRDRLLHANPMTAATDFADAAERANSLLYGALKP